VQRYPVALSPQFARPMYDDRGFGHHRIDGTIHCFPSAPPPQTNGHYRAAKQNYPDTPNVPRFLGGTSLLILATASGLEQSTHAEFPGPHVGTYRNRLLKRALLMSGHPVVLFFDESKIAPHGTKGPFRIGECHSVCDPEMAWNDLVQKQPLALCVGASSEDGIQRVVRTLKAQGPWKAGALREYAAAWCTVLENAVFNERLGNSVENG
jgi:hypothetical protein